jgi:hypothetical protein
MSSIDTTIVLRSCYRWIIRLSRCINAGEQTDILCRLFSLGLAAIILGEVYDFASLDHLDRCAGLKTDFQCSTCSSAQCFFRGNNIRILGRSISHDILHCARVWLWPAPHSEATMGTLRDRGRYRYRGRSLTPFFRPRYRFRSQTAFALRCQIRQRLAGTAELVG